MIVIEGKGDLKKKINSGNLLVQMFPSFRRESRCNEKQDKQEAFIRVISDAPISAGNPYRLILALLTDTRNISRYLVGHMTQPWKTSKFFCFCFFKQGSSVYDTEHRGKQ